MWSVNSSIFHVYWHHHRHGCILMLSEWSRRFVGDRAHGATAIRGSVDFLICAFWDDSPTHNINDDNAMVDLKDLQICISICVTVAWVSSRACKEKETKEVKVKIFQRSSHFLPLTWLDCRMIPLEKQVILSLNTSWRHRQVPLQGIGFF
jgi:hypothetical protein